jgi:hypothetical protein
MKLNIVKLREDIIGDRYSAFVSEFPKSTDKFDELKKKPSCSICIRGALTSIMAVDGFEKKLGVIYGEEVQLGDDIIRLKEKGELELKTVDVFRTPYKEWEEVLSVYLKTNGQRVSSVNTAYDPTKDEIIATIILKPTALKPRPPAQKSIPIRSNPGIIKSNVVGAPQAVPQPTVVPPEVAEGGPSIDDDPNVRARLNR